jgi:hypothetical protein
MDRYGCSVWTAIWQFFKRDHSSTTAAVRGAVATRLPRILGLTSERRTHNYDHSLASIALHVLQTNIVRMAQYPGF